MSRFLQPLTLSPPPPPLPPTLTSSPPAPSPAHDRSRLLKASIRDEWPQPRISHTYLSLLMQRDVHDASDQGALAPQLSPPRSGPISTCQVSRRRKV
ncbi:hypothetical protein P167DRAFT_324157 [Morchella conica CCBAS932]|uniref:Uncharacterized protein n=1 Tax=Morchella conica CCBAS932 TaxID=1392247 RepID=A0A3N4KIE9_9PEZI|nr:hypothetical protein P167DRAFT_324157 [Morchella conica CCBAS932]